MSDQVEKFDKDEIPDDVREAFTYAITYLENYGEAMIYESTLGHLSHYTVPQLKGIAKRFGLKKLSRYHKKELIGIIYPLFLDEETLEKKLLFLSDMGYNALTKKVFKEKTLSVHEVASLNALELYAYIMVTDDGLVILPKAVMELMKKIFKKKGFQQKRKKLTFLYALINFSDYIYTEIDENLLKIMYRSRFKDVSDEEFMNLYHEIEHPLMIYRNHEFISRTVIEQDAFDIVKSIHSRYVISLLSEEEIEDYMNYRYPYSDDMYKAFYLTLATIFGIEPLDAVMVVKHVFEMITIDAGVQSIIDYIGDWTGDLTKERMGILMRFLMELSNNSRHFETYGNIPENLAVDRLKSGGSIHLPDNKELREMIEEHREELNELGYDIDDDGNVFLKNDDQDDQSNNFFS